MTRSTNRIPAAPANVRIPGDYGFRKYTELTRTEVESNEWILAEVREQGARIRSEAAATSEVWFTGSGYERHLFTVRARDFAFRVLVAQGELVQDPTDDRRYIAIR